MSELVSVKALFENDMDYGDASDQDVDKIRNIVDQEIQRRMADLAKIREMYTDVASEVGDGEQVKQIFMDRLSRMIHTADDAAGDESETETDEPEGFEGEA